MAPRPRPHWWHDDQGASLIVVVLVLPVLILFASLAVDTADWFVHKRHLQTQADAGVLAAARDFQFPCGTTATDPPNPQIIARAHQYDGYATGAYNPQISNPASPAPTSATTYSPSLADHNLFSLVNAASYIGQSTPNDTDLTGDPCKDQAVDLKLSETNLPWFFKLAGVDFINAQARMSLQRLATSAGAAPVAIQSSTPNSVHATFIDEANGNAQLGGAELVTADQGATWTNTSPIPISFNGVGSRIGVRIGLSGATNAGTACDTVTFCFDSSSPNNGVSFIHTWDNPTGTVGLPTGTGNTPVGPVVRQSWLVGTASGPTPACLDPTFNASSAACAVALHSNLVFAAADTCSAPASGSPVAVALTINGASAGNLNCPAGVGGSATGEWTSAPVTLAPNSGPKVFQLDYTLTSGEQKPAGATGGNKSNPSTCTPGTNNKCTNNGSQNGFGVITQRIWAGAPDLAGAGSSRSGSISNVAVTDAASGAPLVNDSMQRCSGAATCTKSFNVSVSIFPLASTTDINAAAINLRSSDPQGNGAIDCGQGNGASKYSTAIVSGCPNTLYKAPSGSTSAVCTTAPNECVGVVPGQGKISSALDLRIACAQGCSNNDGSVGQASVPATTCDNPDFWISPNKLPDVLSRAPVDPRIIQLIVVPYGSLAPNGSYNVPIKDFASFYVTGYDANGSQNTCRPLNGTYTSASNGALKFTSDTVSATNEIWGHFITYNNSSGSGTGAGPGTCAPGVASDCIAVLTK